MNNNFADWVLTQLLPEINPYSNINEWVEMEDEDIIYVLESEIEDEDCCGTTIRDAWTWEDIRLYLLKNNYYIVIDIKEVENEIKYESIVYTKDKDGELTCSKSYFSNNYEECRILAIKHCLTFLKLMNNGK